MGNLQSSLHSLNSAHSSTLCACLLCNLTARSIHWTVSSGSEKAIDDPSYDTLPVLSGHASVSSTATQVAYTQFLRTYPEYRDTAALDTLRKQDFTRLGNTKETYVDYMGGHLYPESLVRAHAEFLAQHVMGNTHSVSNSSAISAAHAAEARREVLAFFDAPPGYAVIFTPNATGALKLIGESYPFGQGSTYLLPGDCHNSVNGIRQFASSSGADVAYLCCQAHGGIDLEEAQRETLSGTDIISDSSKRMLSERAPQKGNPSLFVITGMSNISNTKTPLSIAEQAGARGWHTLVDAAALAPTAHISLRENPAVDAMVVSFYKMFGYPTGIGALIAKESFLRQLKRPWFAGGTVDVVQVPGTLVTMSLELYEQFEDGTINYLGLPAITNGLRYLAPKLPLIQTRVGPLFAWLSTELQKLKHETTGAPVVKILSRQPSSVPEGKDRWQVMNKEIGYTLSMIFFDAEGNMFPNSFIEHAAAQKRISLRTGCVCNPGGAAAILGIEHNMALLKLGVTYKDFEYWVGRELGVVRVSLGMVTDFEDVWRVWAFARDMGISERREVLWDAWRESKPAH
ncbi:PLP-dependent transferase [Dacryopinax primogenitus]|uniref:PLP-dependent transferase n=1 Tax=Dacryopinax primogenitus (strain DJM 731) TaxID=1858805 RepID=M5G2T9_DACPD|nr:PLP-dependent transferase [Dacryopinax primogenitus]EJU02540.1 PLP-dependent transferase [Dacryopinax primogenitus]